MGSGEDLESNKATIRRWGDRIWNHGALAETPDLIAEDFVCHRPGGLPEICGHQAHDRWVAEVRERNPSYRVEIFDLIAEGDRVASRWRSTGDGMHMYRMVNGKIAEMWTVLVPDAT